MYRKDVLERFYRMFKAGDLKPNFVRLAEEMGCDYRTVKKAYGKWRYGIFDAE